jgi:Mlc titration factor MtfA (ptsG expression regulator)
VVFTYAGCVLAPARGAVNQGQRGGGRRQVSEYRRQVAFRPLEQRFPAAGDADFLLEVERDSCVHCCARYYRPAMQGLIILAVLIAVPAAVAIYIFGKPGRVAARRARIRERPSPEGLEDVLSRNVGLYQQVPDDLRSQLHGHVNVFLSEKRFLGLGGQEITPEVQLTVAGIACLLLLNKKPSYFPGFASILVYPDTYETTQVENDGVVETHRRSRRAGESWHRGPVVLSWRDVLRGAANAGDGYNVVLHEFAHKLDEENSGTNGQPILRETGHYKEWAEVLSQEYREFAGRVQRRRNRVINEYGLTSPAEFFAVATESFFEKAVAMEKRLPDLYDQLKKYYGVDPASWH